MDYGLFTKKVLRHESTRVISQKHLKSILLIITDDKKFIIKICVSDGWKSVG